ncbi:RRQRL motif-containing zinc-binding protein [Nocardia terpenica]|uniref:Uncharacterized protein n=1 Tax=Nocardia terpenica TaxID=455432 RepID=A0A164MF54_9NOCA|nr:RRQRL motif-containing zinc-binding protein [Nocardia terpenica]KZM73304.1 hypothetical protein AWN90_32090 [Nocardia terpenica]NQE87546.1 hypothetical protein [Nocardia terpenica]
MIGPKDVHRRDLPDVTGERFGVPTYEWGTAPAGYATRRQLRGLRLRPNGQDIAALVVVPRRDGGEPLRAAYLYRIDLAAPKREPTSAQREAVANATRAHQLRAWERHGFDRRDAGEIGDPGPQWDSACPIDGQHRLAALADAVDLVHPERDWGLDR